MPEASRSRIDALSPFDTDPSVAVQAILDRTERPGITLVLFYQYVTPLWTAKEHKSTLAWASESGRRHGLGGRMRIAREGFNCTLTGTYAAVRAWCRELVSRHPVPFAQTDFKLTDFLDASVAWDALDVSAADELVGYGLRADVAVKLADGGVHLEPREYHAKLAEPNTVVIDVRNAYETEIGHFAPADGGATLVDPKLRRSTDFPAWLRESSTRQLLRGKQVLMYCTGGVRCERASSLLKHELGDDVGGVFQLQGGIDKYLKEYSDGGYWQGLNYTFDKRWAHGADNAEGIGQCLRCDGPWSDYKSAQQRCFTCGVPVLVCAACAAASAADMQWRCALCRDQRVTSKAEYREAERRRNLEADASVRERLGVSGAESVDALPVTRLFIGNLHPKKTTEATMVQAFAGITHIQWLKDKDSGKFYGSTFVEMADEAAAAAAVRLDGSQLNGRTIKVRYQPLGTAGRWPPLGTEVGMRAAATPTGMQPKPYAKCRKLFVRNLPPDLTNDEVAGFFSGCEITHMRWMTHRDTGAFRGCGHVDFATAADVDRAALRHGAKLRGKPISLDWAQ